MKKMMKKMMAFILIVAMCAGMWSLPGIVNATESQSVGTGTKIDPMQTGALTLANNSATTGDRYLCLNATNSMAFNWGDHLAPVSGKGGLLHNGVYFTTSIFAITETNGFYFRIGPDSGLSDVKVGDEIKFFGEFTISFSAGNNVDNVGKYVKITPTVVRCTKAEWNETQTQWQTTWELVGSAEEEVVTNTEEYISLIDFGLDVMAGSLVSLDSSKTINGTTFRAFLSYDKSAVDSYGAPHIYYGCSSEGGWNGIRVAVTHIADDKNLITVTQCYSIEKELGRMFMTDSELAAENLLQIKFPTADEQDKGYITVSINDVIVVDGYYMDNVSFNKGYIHVTSGNGYTRSFKSYTELRYADYKLERAEEITAADFGIADGAFTSEQVGNLGYSLDGKKMVFTLTRETEDSDIRAYYGGSSWFQLRRDNDILHYYRGSLTYISQHTQSTNLDPVKLEIYMEYADLDDDGYQDDAKLFVRRDGTKFGTIFEESYFDKDKVWMKDIDALYVITDTLTLTPSSGTASVTSVNTRATATSVDGILTISGEGKVVPSVVSSVVTNAADVTEIHIEDGITDVTSGVFTGYENLESVTYADTVTSVSDTAFTDCASGVRVVSPVGYVFTGGLVDAVHVGSFTFAELDIDRSARTETGLTLEFKPSTAIRGTAEEGNLTATTYSGLQAEIGGTPVAVTFRKTSYGTLACDIPMESLSSADAYTIVLKSGVMKDNDDAQTICLGLKEDFTVYVNKAGLSGTTYVTDHGTVTLSSRTDAASQKEIYFNALSDSFPYGSDVVLKPVDEESGIFLNGTKIDCNLTKPFSVVYYFMLHGGVYSYTAGNTTIDRMAEKGDYLTIYGRFRWGDHIVEFEPFTYRSLGGSGNSSWEVVTPEDDTLTFKEAIIDLDHTGVGYTITQGMADAVVTCGDSTNTYTEGTALYLPGDYTVTKTIDDVDYTVPVILYHQGDVNTDDVLNVKDLVAMKKYQKDSSAYGKAAEQAAISIGTDASAQMTSVRERLVAEKVSKDGTKLPTEIVGTKLGKDAYPWTNTEETDTYITSVQATDNGTTVYGMADEDNAYTSAAEQMDVFDEYGYDYIIDLGATRDFKILQLTDTQIIEREHGRFFYNVDGTVSSNRKDATPEYETETNIEALLTGYMDQVVKDTAPDLILMTGDNIMGEFDDKGTVLQALIDKMDSYGILWAPVFGNHDNESLIGVIKQCQMFNDSKYCLFNRRHEVGGNGNYSIGLAQNGQIKRSIFMMDTNYTANACNVNADMYQPYDELDQLNNCTTPRFTYVQIDWYREAALRINTVAGKMLPSLLAYHIPIPGMYEAELAAGYITTEDNCKYTITDENRAQPGDYGTKIEGTPKNITTFSLIKYMNEVGTDGAFFGHSHANNTSIFYAGVRWTYGVKTGCYDSHINNAVGGTLVTLSSDNYDTFTVTPKMYDCPNLAEDGFECISGRHAS